MDDKESEVVMPTTIVTGPDGRDYEVSHPEGATDEEIIQYAQRNFAPSERPEAPKTTDERRADIAGGTLSIGPLDTSIETPQAVDEFLAGAGRRLAQIGTLGTHETPPEAEALLNDSGYATAGGMVADIGASGGVAGTLTRAPALAAAAASRPLASAALGSGLYSAATSDDRIADGLGGMIGGGLGYGVGKAITRGLSPKVRPEAQDLIDKGVLLTPGQIAGGKAQTFEEAVGSIPLVGANQARRGAMEGWNRVMVDDALAPIGKQLDDGVKAGREAISEAQTKIGNEFDEILENMPVKADAEFATRIGPIWAKSDLGGMFPERESNYFRKYLEEKVFTPLQREDGLTGREYRQVMTGLREQYQSLMKSSNQYQRNMGLLFRDAHDALEEVAARQNSAMAPRLRDAKVAYSKLSRIEDASNAAPGQEGIFTPAQLLRSQKKQAGRKQFAGGTAFGQKEAEAAQSVLGATVPDSGTATRSMATALASGGLAGGGLASGAVSPSALIPWAALAGAYTKPGQAVSRSLMANRPLMMREAGDALDDRLPSILGMLGLSIGTN